MAMQEVRLSIDERILRMARQHADEHGTTLEALLAEHLATLANRAARRLTAREQIYVDCAPSEEVKKALREDFAAERRRACQ